MILSTDELLAGERLHIALTQECLGIHSAGVPLLEMFLRKVRGRLDSYARTVVQYESNTRNWQTFKNSAATPDALSNAKWSHYELQARAAAEFRKLYSELALFYEVFTGGTFDPQAPT